MSDLVTGRLLLHPLSAAEAERVVARGPDPAGGYPTDGDVGGARRYLEVCAMSGDPRPFGPYELRLRDGGRTIGGAGFHAAPGEDGTVTIGYGLIASARGHGYASEALRALLGFARERGVAEVRGDADRDNVASQRVMTAAGMRRVAENDALIYHALRLR